MNPTLFDLHNPELAADYETVFGQHRREVDEDAAKQSASADRILARLREGPATSRDLAAIALKYTNRVSDLRQRGCQIDAERHAGGVWTYTLTSGPTPAQQDGHAA